MKNIILFLSLITLLCVSTDSFFHIILLKKQIEEINIFKEKRMLLNVYFRNALAEINSEDKRIMRKESKGNAYSENWIDFLNKRKKELKEEMKRCGYTTFEIERLQRNAEFYGKIFYMFLNEKEFREEQKEIGYSDEDIDKNIEETRPLYLESLNPFSL